MGFEVGMGLCGICNRMFAFNIERVPCFPIDLSRPPGLNRLSPTGSKEPVCERCFDLTNELRKDAGLEPNHALPRAWDAEEIT